MNQSSKIKAACIVVVAVILALWLGVSLVTNQTETVLYVGASALFLTCVFLGRKIWLLLVFFSALNVPLMRGISTVELGQALFFGFTTIIFLLRRQPLNFKFGEKEAWLLLLIASIVQVYLRNPVGLNIFGASSVGGRPYFTITVSIVTGLLLGNLVIKPSEIKWAMWLSIGGSILGIALSYLRTGGGATRGYVRSRQLDDGRSADRIGSFGTFANVTSRLICSFYSPLRACFHPVVGPLIILTIAAAAGSGYRNNVASVGLTYLIAIAYRGGGLQLVVAASSGAMALGILAFVNLVAPLPPNVQRALSPFPGTWEERYVEAAEESTEWRVEMWKEALFTDYWIKNKIIGDGLGLTKEEVELMRSLEDGGRGLESRGSGMSLQQEAMMITGGYHSGPVQTVRITGYVGLFILLLVMIRMAVYSHRQIMRCKGTEWYPLALYMGIPSISLPIMFTFVFGDYGQAVAAIFFAYGIVSIMEKNIPLPAYTNQKRMPYILKRELAYNARRSSNAG